MIRSHQSRLAKFKAGRGNDLIAVTLDFRSQHYPTRCLAPLCRLCCETIPTCPTWKYAATLPSCASMITSSPVGDLDLRSSAQMTRHMGFVASCCRIPGSRRAAIRRYIVHASCSSGWRLQAGEAGFANGIERVQNRRPLASDHDPATGL